MINNFGDWFSEQVDRTISYTEYIAETIGVVKEHTQKMTWTSDEVEIMIPPKPLGILMYIDYKYDGYLSSNDWKTFNDNIALNRRDRIKNLNLDK